jgi:hypothetical protein
MRILEKIKTNFEKGRFINTRKDNNRRNFLKSVERAVFPAKDA